MQNPKFGLSTMKLLSRSFAEILSARRRLLHPSAVILQSPLYSTSSSTSSKAKPRNPKKQENFEPEISESKDYENDGLELQFEPKIPSRPAIPNLDWPKPKQIPWQAKIANSVNVIGSIAQPVQFQESPDGKFWAGTILSQETAHDSSSLWIPMIFEGYLAHIAACHVKEKDLVHVQGHLSGDPQQLSTEDGHCSIQLMVRDINFVQESSRGKEGYISYKQEEQEASRHSANTKKDYASFERSWRDLMDNPKMWSDYRKDKLNGSIKPKYPDFKHKDNGVALWLDSAPKWVLSELQTTSELQTPSEFQKTSEKEEFWGTSTKKSEGSSKSKKLESWKNLVENPSDWWDNRSGKLSEKSPDFKHKETREALWLNDSPAWVLDKLPPVKPQDIVKRDTLLS